MTVREALHEGVKALTYVKIPLPDLDAEILFADLLHRPKEWLLTHGEREIAEKTIDAYHGRILRRAKGEPVAYITGKKEFYGMEFFVNRDVLIPRPETELLVEECLRRAGTTDHPIIVDIGTGSGCIAITLGLQIPSSRIVATDVSDDALTVAKKNAARHDLLPRMTFVNGNLFEPVRRIKIDLLCANLPYVPEHEILANPDLQFEPIIALRGRLGPDATLTMFLKQWYDRQQRPTAILEIHPNQAKTLLKENNKIGVRVTIKNDLSGLPRIAVVESKY